MNSIIALILVTSAGASQLATFDSLESCELARKNITQHDSFCHQVKNIRIEEHMDNMIDLLNKMKSRMNSLKQGEDI